MTERTSEARRTGAATDPLTGIRFLAAFHVFIFHAWAARGFPSAFQKVEQCGTLPVTLFFVLSGFILCITYGKRGPIDLKSFALARIARIYPLYALCLIGAIFLWLAESPSHFTLSIAASWLTSFLLVQNWTSDGTPAVWGVAWTLSVEALFYLSFPLLLSWVMRQRSRALYIVIAVVCTVYAAFRWVEPAGIFYIAPIRLPEFFVGVILGRLYLVGVLKDRSLWAAALFYAAFAATLIVPQFFPTKDQRFYGLFLPLFAAIILSLTRFSGFPTRFLASRLLIFLGGASYALYLFHGFVIHGMDRLFESVHRSRADSGLLFASMATFLSITLAAFLFKWVEEPARRWIRDRTVGKRSLEAQPESTALQSEPL